MGKNDFLTPKAIANRNKAKGLQKLRWYCQMCQKQCRDENGFKCHCLSESHQRQMQVFGQNPKCIVGGYSDEFERTFMDHLRTSHRHSRVAATVVYNDYIADRHHVHMNSTRWATLTDFVKHLGRSAQCKVDDTPKGWFICYIDRDSETLHKDCLKLKRIKSDLVEEERQERSIAAQIQRASSLLPPPPPAPTPGSQPEPAKVAFALPARPALAPASRVVEAPEVRKRKAVSSEGALEEMMREEEREKERSNRRDYWLCGGIVVKVMSEGLEGYYKRKGVVRRVVDKYVGEIEMLKSKHVLRVDQAELETVIPQLGGVVRVVNGAYRGSNARLVGVDTKKFCAKVQIEKGIYAGRVLQAVDYEDICKVA